MPQRIINSTDARLNKIERTLDKLIGLLEGGNTGAQAVVQAAGRNRAKASTASNRKVAKGDTCINSRALSDIRGYRIPTAVRQFVQGVPESHTTDNGVVWEYDGEGKLSVTFPKVFKTSMDKVPANKAGKTFNFSV